MKQIVVTLLSLILIVNISSAKENNKPAESAPFASSSLSGKIIDSQSGEELVGVAVKIKGTDKICYTDFDGNFQFESITPGNYKLDIELISYIKTEIKKITIDGHEAHELSIKLKQDL